LAWSLDGRRLATGSKDSSIIIWHPDHSTLPHLELKGHQDSVDQIVWSPTDRYIFASGSSDKTIIIWDGKQGKELNKFEVGEIINMIWSFDGKRIIAGTKVSIFYIIFHYFPLYLFILIVYRMILY
jgi:WD40 repeat protein